VEISIKFYKVLKIALLIVTCGCYCLPVSAGEIPGHPKGPSEIQEEEKREKRENSPTKHMGDENQQEQYKKGIGDWACNRTILPPTDMNC
jgi:hypothetical protein